LAQITDLTVYRGSAASLTRAAEWGKAALVHFSCHGQSSQEYAPLSHLRLSDDLLLAHDVMRRFPPLADGSVVLLNGCETGARDQRADDEGMGLMSAFLLRRASLILATQWSVQDPCAAEIVTQFVHAYRNEGKSPAEAIRIAVKATRGLKHDEIDRRRAELISVFPPSKHPFESTKLYFQDIIAKLGKGEVEQARSTATSLISRLERMLDEGTETGKWASGMIATIRKTVENGQAYGTSEYPYDDPVYWSAFHLVGRIA
jgi:CHAT domain-containing protein